MIPEEERTEIKDAVYEAFGFHSTYYEYISREVSGMLVVPIPGTKIEKHRIEDLAEKLGYDYWELNVMSKKTGPFVCAWFYSDRDMHRAIEEEYVRAEHDPENRRFYMQSARRMQKKRAAIADRPLDKAAMLVRASEIALEAEQPEHALRDARRAVKLAERWNNSKTYGDALNALEIAEKTHDELCT